MKLLYGLLSTVGVITTLIGIFGVEVWLVNDVLIDSALHDPVAMIVLGINLAFVGKFVGMVELAMGDEDDEEAEEIY